MVSKKQNAVRQTAARMQPAGAQSLPSGDPLSTLKQLSSRLDALSGVSSARVRGTIERIEQLGQPSLASLLLDYLSRAEEASDANEQQIWSTVIEYLDRLMHTYRLCLDNLQSSAGTGGASDAALIEVAIDLIRVCGVRQKWGYLRHYPVTQEQWELLSWSYLAAARCTTSAQQERGGESAQAALDEGFLKVIVLAAGSPSGLAPAQIELAECLIEHCAGELRFAAQDTPPTGYFVDFSAPVGPQRLLRSMTIPSSGRAIDLSRAIQKLEQLAEDFHSGMLTPADLGIELGGRCPPGLANATARHLLRHWRNKPERRHARQRQVFRVAVAHGFDEVAPKLTGGALHAAIGSWQEDWIIENRSASGLLALLQRGQGRVVQAGNLIAFRAPNEASWQAGIVRRAHRDEEETRHLAIERLPTSSTPISIQPGVAQDEKAAEQGLEAVQLQVSSAADDQICLLLPVGTYSSAVPLQMQREATRYLLIPQRLVESGIDFEIACFKLIKRAGKP